MVPILSLWLPIVVSSVIIFLMSYVVHTILPYHKGDFGRLPSEDEARDVLRKINIPPGEYSIPYASGMKEMSTEEYGKKLKEGPVVFMTVRANGSIAMGKVLGIWFVYCLVVGVFAAYVAGRALEPGAHYLAVFRFVGVTAFCCYTIGLWQESIWFGKPWSTTAKNTFDGLLYALLTAGTFGWLWPE